MLYIGVEGRASAIPAGHSSSVIVQYGGKGTKQQNNKNLEETGGLFGHLALDSDGSRLLPSHAGVSDIARHGLPRARPCLGLRRHHLSETPAHIAASVVTQLAAGKALPARDMARL